MGILSFLNNWQVLIGSLIGSLSGALTAVVIIYLDKYLREKNERKKQYSSLLLILHDIKQFISKCEHYSKSYSKNLKPYDKIFIKDKLDYSEPSRVFNLKSEVYFNIQQIYNIANVIKLNLNEQNLVGAISMISYFLTDIYRRFNRIVIEIEKLQKIYKYLEFPNDINLYKKEHVIENIEKFNLVDHNSIS